MHNICTRPSILNNKVHKTCNLVYIKPLSRVQILCTLLIEALYIVHRFVEPVINRYKALALLKLYRYRVKPSSISCVLGAIDSSLNSIKPIGALYMVPGLERQAFNNEIKHY